MSRDEFIGMLSRNNPEEILNLLKQKGKSKIIAPFMIIKDDSVHIHNKIDNTSNASK